MSPADPAQITDYHIHHVYYDSKTRERAKRLRNWIEERFAVRMGRWHDAGRPASNVDVSSRAALIASFVDMAPSR
jgi:aromatic ring-cleaving dioxygenase